MAFVVQTETGTEGANSYLSVAAFRAYHVSRGRTLAGYTDAQLEAALVRATDHLDGRFRYVGRKLSSSQTTEWPRYDAEDVDERPINGIPKAVLDACAEYGLRALTSDLNPDMPRSSTGAVIVAETHTVGPITDTFEYALDGSASLPEYPAADLKLERAGLVRTGGEVRRG